MPVDRSVRLSVQMFCELLGIEPSRFVDIEIDKLQRIVTVVQEPIDEPLPAAFSVAQFDKAITDMALSHGPDPTGHP